MDEKDSTFQDLGDNDELQHIMDEIDTLEKGFDEEEKFIISPKKIDIMTLKKNVSDDLVQNELKDTSNVSIAKSEECAETVKAVNISQKTEAKNPVFLKTKKEVFKDEKRGEMSFNMDFKVYGKQVDLKVSEKEGLCLKTENLKVVIEQDKLRLNLNDGTSLTMPWACDIKKAV